MTKKGITIVLAIACVLSIVGAALAAAAWFADAPSEGTTLGIGDAITMELNTLTNDKEDVDMYPGDTATISIQVDNKSLDAILTIELECGEFNLADYFEITYTGVGKTDEAYVGGISITGDSENLGTTSVQTVTFKITLKTDANPDIAGETVSVTIALELVD